MSTEKWKKEWYERKRKWNIQRENIMNILIDLSCFEWEYFVLLVFLFSEISECVFNVFIHEVNQLCIIYMKHEHVVSMKMIDKYWISSAKVLGFPKFAENWKPSWGYRQPQMRAFSLWLIFINFQFFVINFVIHFFHF